MIAWLRKYWAQHAAAIAALVYYAIPVVQQYVDAHPKTKTGILLGAIVIVFHSSAPKDQEAVAIAKAKDQIGADATAK